MSAHNGPECGADDSQVTRARSLSRFVRRLLEAEPQLLAEKDVKTPLDRAGMLTKLGAHHADDAALMRALRAAEPDISFIGVGGAAMTAEGLQSLFPLEDIAVMGLLPVLGRLPTLLARIAQTTRAIIDAAPDCLVLIDAPDFTHRVARHVRRQRPHLPIIDYVSPTVWAWRPGRARARRPSSVLQPMWIGPSPPVPLRNA